ncbi:MAG: hypothetical protein ACE37F_16535 [Nannocystaceae bacterium]|nr:hypothetical protein [bacterium]
MGYFDDLFSADFLFDSEYKQRADIQQLKADLEAAPDPSVVLGPLAARVDRLELLCKALTELIMSKGLATRDELSVVSQQLDLADGVEDGKISARVRKAAPRCPSCGRFVNPRRDNCVYCHATVAQGLPDRPPERTVSCGGCGKDVPESGSFYTASGLRCDACFEQVLP